MNMMNMIQTHLHKLSEEIGHVLPAHPPISAQQLYSPRYAFACPEPLVALVEVEPWPPRDQTLLWPRGVSTLALSSQESDGLIGSVITPRGTLHFVSDTTGPYVTGLDDMPAAIRQAAARTASKADRLSFMVGDINALKLPPTTFDAIISIDTIYFSTDYSDTVGRLTHALRPSGQMTFFYGYGVEPGIAVETFPRETLEPERTPLAEAFRANGLCFSTTGFTVEKYRLAQLRKQVLAELKQDFIDEDILFIYENRMGEAEDISDAIEQGLHRRYLYVCHA